MEINKKIINFLFLPLVFFSFLFSDSVNFKISYLNLSITDILLFFFIIYVFVCNLWKLNVVLLSLYEYRKFLFVILFLLLLKFIKLSFDFSNFLNFYEFLAFIFVLLIFLSFYILFFFNIIKIRYIKNLFLFIFYISMLIILISIILYNFDYQNNLNLWEYKKVHYPYFGENIVHFNGFLNHYNMQAYIMIPGYFFLLFEKRKNLFSYLIIICFIIMLFLIKAKIFVIISLLTFLIIIINLKKINKIFIFIFLISIFCGYTLITQFLILDTSIFLSTNNQSLNTYYTYEPLISFGNWGVYGSLFYKLKVISINHLIYNKFLFFNEINFIDFHKTYLDNLNISYKSIVGHDPHSEYFGSLSNYGIIGFATIVFFLLFPLYKINNILDNQNYILFSPMFFIFFTFVVEAVNTDILHFRFYWILISLFLYKLKTSNRDIHE